MKITVFAALLCLVGTIYILPLAAETPPPTAGYLRPAKLAAWWQIGESAEFRLDGGGLPDGAVAVEGAVSDLSGNSVARVSVAKAKLDHEGWTWKPTEPGYYEVEFSAVDAGGAKTPLTRSFKVRAPNGASKVFTREKQGLAIVPAPQDPPPAPAGQFGFDYGGHDTVDLQFARWLGFDTVRLPLNWGADFTNLNAGVESVQGKDRWELFDPGVELFSKAGFVIMAQILYTPVWSSPHPELAGQVNICVDQATAYAPKDLAEFGRFVGLAVDRYKDRIHLWEIWNEPSIEGGSCFWADTSENFVKLLETGYRAVKKAQPDGEVWIGGLGPNPFYEAFYNRVLELGGARYFDVLSLHGSYCTPAENFRAIEERNGVPPKPAVNSEWHAILQGNMQSEPILSEPALSLKMIKDLLYQLKHGVSRTILFELHNLEEKETLSFDMDNKWFVHASGLFRKRPQWEPRQAAVVMANFLTLTGRKASFVREFALSDQSTAVELSTARGPLVAFWSDQAAPALDKVRPFASASSLLVDWEGKMLSLDGGTTLEPKKLYYLTTPNDGMIAKAAPADKLVSPRSVRRTSQTASTGVYHQGKLFETADKAAVVPERAWLQTDWKLTKLTGAHDPAFSARAAFGAHREGLDIVVEVHDSEQVQKEPAPSWWNGDSVQIAVDCRGAGFLGGNAEIILALTEQGPVAWKLFAADPQGDIPAQWSPAGSPAKFAAVRIVREGSVTRYQLRLPWSELFPLRDDPSKELKVALVVNNNNGQGRQEYLGWSDGIAGAKDPSRYGVLRPLPTK